MELYREYVSFLNSECSDRRAEFPGERHESLQGEELLLLTRIQLRLW